MAGYAFGSNPPYELFLGEGAGMAQFFAAAIRSTGAKREAEFEGLAVAHDVLDA
jgi:hypothetical protein